ncbi:MAG: diaminopimelate epimerase [Spirochaetaceae bacterium]|nr:diaminopimelate epimerase [Spirochaetaceae bacterium]
MSAGPHFRKYHGLGNDYLVINPAEFPFEPTEAAVRAVCDRNRGVGSDGILLGPLPGTGPSLRIFNPDGSEAAKSGNGLRIFAWYLHEAGLASGREFPLLTKGGPVVAAVVDEAAKLVRMDMGPPNFAAAAVPVLAEREEAVDMAAEFGGKRCRITCVSMGNPHCVVLGLGSSGELARELGPLIERFPLFPDRVNVQFLEPLGPAEIRISIWERGAGYTLASGSSSCAAAAAARRLGLAGDEVLVRMPGGALRVEFAAGTTFLTGPVEKAFEGTFSDELRARILGREPAAPDGAPGRKA